MDDPLAIRQQRGKALASARRGGALEAREERMRAGGDPHIRDSKHDSDAIGWAEFFRQPEFVQLLKTNAKT